jgi:hypothetical protein
MPDAPAAARARLREIALRQSIGEIKREDATTALEKLTSRVARRREPKPEGAATARGAPTPRMGRYRDAFQLMRTGAHRPTRARK